MKRTSLPARTKPLRRTKLKTRSKPLKRSPLKRNTKAIPKVGERGRLWINTRNKLKKEFQSKSIERCELCGSEFGLGFAHRYKRRFIVTIGELEIVVLLCNHPCHAKAERMKHKDMKEFLDSILAGRDERYWQSC